MGFNFAALRSSFFDRSKVLKAATLAKRRAFGKAGAFIRTRARTSIKRKEGKAPPGKPPHAHHPTGMKLIFFSWDDKAESVVVGPILFENAKGPPFGAKLLEHGGVAQFTDDKGVPRRWRYRGNPTMAPAVKAELPKFAGLFKPSAGG